MSIPMWVASRHKLLRSTVIQGDSGSKVSSLGGDVIGHCEQKNKSACV